jgi:hypothetical protein
MSEQRSLVKKLAEVMAAVERIPKRGRNDFHKYDYATEADIAATVREELAKRSVMLIPSIRGEARHPVGEKGSVLTVLEMEMSFHDGESGERLDYPWRGYGTDKEDKGGYKAMTGGEKYFLLKTFLMPTGDDPEHDDRKPVARQPEARRPMPTPQAPQPAAGGERLISEGQAKRFFAIARGVGWSNDEIKTFLKKQLNVETSAQIPLAQYERICKAVETGEVVNA